MLTEIHDVVPIDGTQPLKKPLKPMHIVLHNHLLIFERFNINANLTYPKPKISTLIESRAHHILPLHLLLPIISQMVVNIFLSKTILLHTTSK